MIYFINLNICVLRYALRYTIFIYFLLIVLYTFGMTPMKIVNFRIPAFDYEKLQELAEVDGLNVSEYIRHVLKRHIKKSRD